MFEALHFIPFEVGTAIATWGAVVALWATAAAGFLNAAKENDGVHGNV